MAGYAVPHFQVVLGGEWENNGASYGLPVIAIPSKNIPEVVSRLTDRYAANRTEARASRILSRDRQSRIEKNARRSGAPAGRFVGPFVLPGLGRSPGIHASRILEWASAPEKLFPPLISIWAPPKGNCSRPRWRSRAVQIEQGRADGVSIHAARRERRW